MNYNYLWIALGALTMFTLGALSFRVVQNIRDDQLRAQNKRDRELQYRIDNRILSYNYHDRILENRSLFNSTKEATAGLTRRVVDFDERLENMEKDVAKLKRMNGRYWK